MFGEIPFFLGHLQLPQLCITIFRERDSEIGIGKLIFLLWSLCLIWVGSVRLGESGQEVTASPFFLRLHGITISGILT